MKPMYIETDAGSLELIPATLDQLRVVARYWPMGLLRNSEDPLQYGLVFQQGEKELIGIKLQSVDIPEEDAQIQHLMYRSLIALSLPIYLKKENHGIMLPCAYYKEKSEGLAETGVAIFVGPGPSSEPEAKEDSNTVFDTKLGNGATSMVFDMIGALDKASKDGGFPTQFLGIEPRPRLAIGGLAMHFLVVAGGVIVVKDPLDKNELVWKSTVQAGFSRLLYAPMQPTCLSDPESSYRRG